MDREMDAKTDTENNKKKDVKIDKKILDRLKVVIRNLLLLLCAAALTEILLFNFRSIQSLFYKEHSWEEYSVEYSGVKIYDGGIISIEDEAAVISLRDIDMDVKNVRLELELPDAIDLFYMESGVCYVDVAVCDEGSGSVMYGMLEDWPVHPQNLTSQFKWMQPMGKVQSLELAISLPVGHLLKINGITLNARKPLHFSMVRFLAVWFVLLLCYGLRKRSNWWKEDCRQMTVEKKVVLSVIFLAFFAISFSLMSSNPSVTNQTYNPYQELAWALDAGQVELLDAQPHHHEGVEEPVHEQEEAENPLHELEHMENPYSFYERYNAGLEYKYDFAYYNGHYYVQQGILPCLLFYLPLYHLTGLNMPNSIPVFFCCLLFGIGLLLLMRQIIIRYFPKTPFAMLVLITLTGLFGCQLPFFTAQPDAYILTVICAVMLVVWGLYFWISAKKTEQTAYSKGRIVAGSLCMAMVAAVKPTFLLYSILGIVIFGRAWFTNKEGLNKKSRMIMIALFAIPYVAVGIPVMYYNAVRFGSLFEFGSRYLLTTVDCGQIHFSIDRIYYAVREYFFRIPDFNYFFPFINTFDTYWDRAAHSAVLFERSFQAGLIPFNTFLLAAAVVVEKRKEFQKKGLYAFCVCLPLIGFLLMMLDVELTGSIAYRYLADFAFALFIAAWAGILWLQEQYDGKDSHRAFRKILVTLVLVSVALNSVFWFTTSDNFPMQSGNTQLYYDIYYGFNFW